MADISLTEVSDIILDEGRISADHYRTIEGRIFFWGLLCGSVVMWSYKTYGDFGFWISFPFWIGFLLLCYGWVTAKTRRARDLGYSGWSFWSSALGFAGLIGGLLFVTGQTLGASLALGYTVIQTFCLMFYLARGQRFDSRFGAYPAIYTETGSMQVVGWLAFAFYAMLSAYIVLAQAGIVEEQLTDRIGALPFMEGVADITFDSLGRSVVPVDPPPLTP